MGLQKVHYEKVNATKATYKMLSFQTKAGMTTLSPVDEFSMPVCHFTGT